VIDYEALDEVCAAAEVWEGRHEALAAANPKRREEIAHILLDYMRRELAIDVDYLRESWQEQLNQRSSQSLVEPWGLEVVGSGVGRRRLCPAPRSRVDR
jgi:hypothetical protein